MLGTLLNLWIPAHKLLVSARGICHINYSLIRMSCKTSCTAMSKKALVFLAPGAEEMEFVIAADVLRRGGVSI